MRNRLSVALVTSVLMSLSFAAAASAADGKAESYWPQWRGPLMTGVAPHRDASRRVERDQECPLEGGDPRQGQLDAGRVGRPHLRAERRSDGRAEADSGDGDPAAPAWSGRAACCSGRSGPPGGRFRHRRSAPQAAPAAPAVPPHTGPAPAAPGRCPEPGASPAWRATGPAVGWAQAGPAAGRRAVSCRSTSQQFTLLAISRADGKLLWKRCCARSSRTRARTRPARWASSSAATDGEIVFAFFGSRGLYALDMNGKLLWEKDLGDMTVKLGFGEGSTPALGKDRVVVQWDHEGESFLVALDKKTGQELWRQKREEEHLVGDPARRRARRQDAGRHERHQQGAQLRPGPRRAAVGDAGHDGERDPHARARGRDRLPDERLPGQRAAGRQARRAKGDIQASPAIAWKLDRDTPYVPSPLLYGDELYFLKGNNGLLTCLDAKTGETPLRPGAPRGRPERLRLAGGRRRPRLRRRPRGRDGGRRGAAARSSCSRRTSSRTASTPRPWRWTRSSTCAGRSTCTGFRSR